MNVSHFAILMTRIIFFKETYNTTKIPIHKFPICIN